MDGVREYFGRDFTQVYHVDLNGNVREHPELSGTTHNVFGIKVGVGITIALKSERDSGSRIFIHSIEQNLRREEKLNTLR